MPDQLVQLQRTLAWGTDRVRRVMTSVDEEWYWLQRIAELQEASSAPDGWAIAQTIASFASTLGTLALAVFAAYIAWKSHQLSREVADADIARAQRAERDEFAEMYLAYLASLTSYWPGTTMGAGGHSGAGYAQVAVRATVLGEDMTTGPRLLISQLNRFEEDADKWPRESQSAEQFGRGIGLLMQNISKWARDGRDQTIPTDGSW